MKKNLFITLMVCLIVILLSGCSSGAVNSSDLAQSSDGTSSEVNKETDSKEIATEKETSKAEAKEMSMADFEELLMQLPMAVVSTKYVVQDDTYKSLYPDLLQAILKNDTEHDIKNAVVAFVAWDENKLPVKIKGNIDFSHGSYVKLVNYNDINLVPGKTYGHNSGFELDQTVKIESFKAIVVSYEAFDGATWENPLFSDWKVLYEGKKLQ